MEMDKDKFALLEKRMTEPMEGDHEAPQTKRRMELKTLDPEPRNEYLPLNEPVKDPKCPLCHLKSWEPTEGDHEAPQQRRMELKTLDPEPKNEYLPLNEPVKDPKCPLCHLKSWKPIGDHNAPQTKKKNGVENLECELVKM